MKKPKPFTAWGFLHKEGNTISDQIYRTRKDARSYLSGCIPEAQKQFKIVKLTVRAV